MKLADYTISSQPDQLTSRESRGQVAEGFQADVRVVSHGDARIGQVVVAYGSPAEVGDAARGVVREYQDVLKRLADH